jgi:regulator of RNase E activity RraA
MDTAALFAHLRKFDTPTICNAIEVAIGARFTTGFTRQTLIAAHPKAAPIVGYARTCIVRCSVPFDATGRKERLQGYYAYVEQGPRPTISVVQDIDSMPGLGAFWGEVNTTVHWNLGCVGALTNGSMRDLDMMHPDFQCIAASLSPSHAYIQVLDFGKPVDVCGMLVTHDDVVHADYHGAVVIPAAALEKLPDAIDLMARKEKVILDAARQPGFTAAKWAEAMAGMEKVK